MKSHFPLATVAVVAALLGAGCASSVSSTAAATDAATGKPGDSNAASTPAADTTTGHADNAAQSQLKIGDVAPAFVLRDQDNKEHKLSDYRGKVVVLAFYPADMTKGCTLEAHRLSAIAPELQKRGVQLFGISVQDVNSKKQFCDKEGITYTLLADAAKSASRDYGVLGPRGVANRTTFVVAPDGTIGAIQEKVQPASADKDTLQMVNQVLKSSASSQGKAP